MTIPWVSEAEAEEAVAVVVEDNVRLNSLRKTGLMAYVGLVA